MSVKQIVLTGSAYEKGLCYGRECRNEITAGLENYRRLFLKEKRMTWETAREAARRFLPFLTGQYDEYLEEMRGIADGARVTFDDILILNCRSEILYSSSDTGKAPDECTAFSAVAPAAAPGVTLAGQTWDYTVSQRDAVVIVRIPRENGIPARLLFLEAGMIGGIGVNAAGIALTLNALATRGSSPGVPLRFRMRRILEQDNMNGAYAEATRTPVPFAAHLTVTHKDGLSLGYELDPLGCDVLLPENGLIVHTNHYLGPRMVLHHGHADRASSYCRLQIMKQDLQSRKELTLPDIEEFFRDHRGYPVSVCLHVDPRLTGAAREDDYQTNMAFAADLKSGTVRFVHGNPCEGEFITLPIEA